MSNAPLNSEQPGEPVGSTNPAADDSEHLATPEVGSMNPGPQEAEEPHVGEREVGSANPAHGHAEEGYGSTNPGPAAAEEGWQDFPPVNRERFSRPDDAFVGPERPRRGGALIAAALAGALVVGGVSGGVVSTLNSPSNSPSSSSAATSTSRDGVKSIDERVASPLADVVQTVSPSVVTIGVSLSSGGGGTGSGIVLNSQGYIVTNAHVATLEGESTSGKLSVQTSTGDVYPAKLVGYDATADTAVLKIDSAAKGIKPITFANSDKLETGDQTIAIGSPLGLAGTVTSGIVSAINRPISVPSSQVQQDQSTTQGAESISLNAIQTDAAINPGNSGGALLNASGDLVGMNDAIATAPSSSTDSGSEGGSIGIGFAIPSNYVKRVAEEIIKSGKATHGRLGAVVENSSSADSSSLGFGATLRSVEPGSAAAKAGLKAGDVITKVNDTVISDATQLTALVRQQAPGAAISMTYKRGSATTVASVTLTAAPQ